MVKWDRALDTSDFTTRKSLWRDQTTCIIHISDFGHQVYFTWQRGLHVDQAELFTEKLCAASASSFPSQWNSAAHSQRNGRRAERCAWKRCFWITLLWWGIFLTFRAAELPQVTRDPSSPCSAFLRAARGLWAPFLLSNPLLSQLNQIKLIVIIFPFSHSFFFSFLLKGGTIIFLYRHWASALLLFHTFFSFAFAMLVTNTHSELITRAQPMPWAEAQQG